MLQKDVNLVSLDASWVSSASWYIINLFGLRSMYTLVLGADNAADQTKMMQDQMSGAALSMPDDLNKAFKVNILFYIHRLTAAFKLQKFEQI
jgi:hypothetical protein